jgi:hypothetical protein
MLRPLPVVRSERRAIQAHLTEHRVRPARHLLPALDVLDGRGGHRHQRRRALSKFETTEPFTVEEMLDALRRVPAVGYRKLGPLTGPLAVPQP